jgi:sugar lactone lactonase YvrE
MQQVGTDAPTGCHIAHLFFMNPSVPNQPVSPAKKSPAMAVTRFLPRLPLAGLAMLLTGAFGTLASLSAQTSEYAFTTIAGVGSKPGSTDGVGGGANLPLFNRPIGLVVNSAGNIYVTDSGNSLIRVVTPAGVVTTLAGSPGRIGITDGTGVDADARFNSPQGPAVDSAGNIYLADYNSSTIRKITPAGVVTTFAGTAGTTGSADGTGTAATFKQPSGVAVDSSGNIYVADSGNHIIRKITPAGVVTTFAGTAAGNGSTDSTGSLARFSTPRGIATDSAGNVYVADTNNNAIRKITPAGVVTTVAGQAGTFGTADGQGTAARFNYPLGITVDSAGNIYVADVLNNAIRKISSSGDVTTLAGQAGADDGRVNGTGSAARFARPTGVSVDSSGNIYVADDDNQQIRKVSPTGVVTTVAGVGGVKGTLDGTGYLSTPALFFGPSSTATDSAGNVYVADAGNNAIRKISASGVVTTLAGNAKAIGWHDGTGSDASFTAPSGLALDNAGNVYVADTGNHAIRKVTPAGVVTTIAGTSGTAGATDGTGTAASFSYPSDVAVDGSGNVYVADYDNHTIRKITSAGQVTTFAGSAGVMGQADGVGSAARFNYPRAVALDSAGNVYVTDSGNHTVRKITPAGLVVTLAGLAGTPGSGDGSGSSARFKEPAGLAVDAAGNVFVADTGNSTLRKITPGGSVTTLAGSPGAAGNTDGLASVARFNGPTGIAVDAAGYLYIADTRNQTIRKGVPPGGSATSGAGGAGGNSGTGGSGSSGGGSGGALGDKVSGSIAIGATNSASSTGRGFLLHPSGIKSDTLGNLFITDTANNCIKKIATDGTIAVFAGKSGTAGSADGTGTAATFNGPAGLMIDTANNIYVCDTGNVTIRKITAAGVVTTFAGTAGKSGTQDGTGSAASFTSPKGIAMDGAGNLYVTDSVSNTIRKITTDAVVTTYAGTANSVGDADGVGSAARFNGPTGIITDATNNIYVTDTYNNTVRKIATRSGTVARASGTIVDAGNAKVVVTAAGLTGSPISLDVAVASGNTPATWAAAVVTALQANAVITARYSSSASGSDIRLQAVATDTADADLNISLANGTCTGIVAAPTSVTTPASQVTTVAGSAGISGVFDGNGIYALFNQPSGIAVDGGTNLYVTDTGNNCIRRVTARGAVTTLAGISGISGSRDGPAAMALFNQPQALIAAGTNLAIVDTGNSIIRVVDSSFSTVSTMALKEPTTTPTTGGTSTSSSGGGGGSVDTWFLGALLTLAGIAYRRRQGVRA